MGVLIFYNQPEQEPNFTKDSTDSTYVTTLERNATWHDVWFSMT